MAPSRPSPFPAPPPPGGPPWLLLALAVEAALAGGDLLWGTAGRVSAEERYNAEAAVMVACGHLDRVWDLQYRPFCGGCTAEAILGAPLARWLGPTVGAWKLVPLGLHLAAVAAGLGALIGATPILAGHLARPDAIPGDPGWWLGWRPAPLEAWARYAGESLGFFSASPAPWPGARGAWWVLLALAATGAARALRTGRGRRAAGVALLLGFGLAAAWWARWDLWRGEPVARGYDWFNLRYRVYLWPPLALAAALLAASRPGRLALGAWVAVGLAMRVGGWTDPAGGWRRLAAPVGRPGERPDATVPSGAPRRRLARRLDRPGDVAAALAFVHGHVDPLGDCEDAHLGELGRRMGLALLAGRTDPVVDAAAELGPGEVGAVAEGLSLALAGEPDARRLLVAQDRLDVAAPELGEAAALALGRRLARNPENRVLLEQLSLDPRVAAGACAGDPAWCGR